jgi:uncharacterized protein with ATP-grasp and redox domains
MRIECVPCLLTQILKAIRLVRPEALDDFIKNVMDEEMAYLRQGDIMVTPPGKVGQNVYKILGEMLEDPDRMRILKDSSIRKYSH